MKALRTINVAPKKRNRTFTIYEKENGRTIKKHRTYPHDKEVFENMRKFTQEEWRTYLKYVDDHYVVK